MNSKTVCIKLTTGDELFAELMLDDEAALEQNFVKVYQPYSVKVFNREGRTNLMLSPWQLFSDDMTFMIQANHIVSINSLDDQHSQVYGSMVANTELKIIQGEIAHAAKLGVLTAKQIENSLKETLGILMKSGVKYNLQLPELNQVKNDYYTFLMGQYENDLTVIH